LNASGFVVTNLTILGGSTSAGLIIGILSQLFIRACAPAIRVIYTRMKLENRVQRAERERMKALFGMVETSARR
jgi:hypothetical protein